jgi:hypothetical protein
MPFGLTNKSAALGVSVLTTAAAAARESATSKSATTTAAVATTMFARLGSGYVLAANLLGIATSVMFMVMYVPQFMLNRRRRSTEGFSSTGIVIKLVGASFLAVNAWVTGEAIAVVLYGALGVLQHDAFMVQFYSYERRHNLQYLLWILSPVVPYFLAQWLPVTMLLTNYIKPVSQIASHIPQLLECRRLRTAAGVSLWSQHLNFLGGLGGMYMCWAIPPRSPMPWLLYIFSVLQAVTLYMAWLYYDSGYFAAGRVSVLPMENEKRY